MSEAGRKGDPERPSLLIVDDERDFRDHLAEILVSQGFAVMQAASGMEAVATLHAHTPDIMITDIVMEGMDGFELISRVRKFRPCLPIIAVSGTGLVEAKTYLRMAQQLGADLTLEKPLRVPELLEAVSRILSQRRASGEGNDGVVPA